MLYPDLKPEDRQEYERACREYGIEPATDEEIKELREYYKSQFLYQGNFLTGSIEGDPMTYKGSCVTLYYISAVLGQEPRIQKLNPITLLRAGFNHCLHKKAIMHMSFYKKGCNYNKIKSVIDLIGHWLYQDAKHPLNHYYL